jgi:hypothetical protein
VLLDGNTKYRMKRPAKKTSHQIGWCSFLFRVNGIGSKGSGSYLWLGRVWENGSELRSVEFLFIVEDSISKNRNGKGAKFT